MYTPLMLYGTPIVIFPASVLVEKFDIIHANFPSPYLASVSSIVSMMRSIPSVLTWHNDLPPVTSGAAILMNLHNKLAVSYLNNFDAIIATTQAYSKKSIILRRLSSKVQVVSNGVDTRRFSPSVDGEKIRTLHNLKDCKIALFVGALTTFHAYKGVEILIGAFSLASKKCKNVRLVIVGGGNLLQNYRQQASGLGVSDLVTFAGYVSDHLLPEYYAASDFAVLPSKDSSEGFGLVLLEAMASGKAVIGTEVGGIVDVISNGDNGLLVPPMDMEALSRAMITLFENDDLRLRMGIAGVEFSKFHDWNVVAREVEEIYRQIQTKSA
jgi:glycosyltransferase involved in cell wall biosynthesis